MFEIEYKGANAVIITTKKTRIIFDPKSSVVSGHDIDTSGEIEVVTEERFVADSTTPRLLLDSPGEYGVGDVSLTGVAAIRHLDTGDDGLRGTVYKMSVGDVRMAVIGNIAPRLSEDQLEKIGVVDLVVIPVGGGGYTLDAVDAAAIVRQIDPRAVVPVHYDDANLKYEVPQEGIGVFVEKLGVGIIEAGSKYKIKGLSSLPDQLTIIKVSRS